MTLLLDRCIIPERLVISTTPLRFSAPIFVPLLFFFVLVSLCLPFLSLSLSLSLFSLFFRIQGGDTGRCSKRGARRSTHVKGFNYCGDLAWTVALGAPDHLIAVFIGSFSFILLHLSGESSVAFISAHEPADHGFCRGSQPPVVRVRVISLVPLVFHQANRHLCAYIRVSCIYTCAKIYSPTRKRETCFFFKNVAPCWLLVPLRNSPRAGKNSWKSCNSIVFDHVDFISWKTRDDKFKL